MHWTITARKIAHRIDEIRHDREKEIENFKKKTTTTNGFFFFSFHCDYHSHAMKCAFRYVFAIIQCTAQFYKDRCYATIET